MLNPQGATFARLRADIDFTNSLALYGVEPSLFSSPVPSDLDITEAVTAQVDPPVNADDDDTYSEDYRAFDVRVKLFQKTAVDGVSVGTAALDAAANNARRAIKDWPKGPVTGGVFISAAVTGPADLPSGDSHMAGRLLQVRILMQEI